MALMQEYGFTVRPDREGDFQEWLRGNEEQLRSAVPASIRYVGTYGVAFSSEKDAGSPASSWNSTATAQSTRSRRP